MAKRDFYEVLGVPRDASDADLKKSFRRLAMELHPDRNPGDKQAEERFKEVNEAYGILSDSQKRAQYDQFGHDGPGFGPGGGMPSDGINLEDLFGGMFGDIFGGGGGRRGGGPRRGADLKYVLDLEFEKAVFGTEVQLQIPRHKSCGDCAGSGAQKGTRPRACDQCGGSGQQRFQQGFLSVARTCPRCHGAGQVIASPCGTCRGSGAQRTQASVAVKVPAGVDTGIRLRVSGEGEPGERGAPSGDLYVVIQVREHSLFKRHEHDLVLELPLSMTQAALGTTVEVPTLQGRETLHIPPGTQHGDRFTLRGKGVPELGGRGRGDQHVLASIEIPKHLTLRQRELLEEFAEASGDGAQMPRRQGFLDRMRDLFGGD